jgi:hypothetical protein
MEPIQISKARDCLGDLASRVVFGKERIILTKNHKELALISIEDLRALEAYEDEQDIRLAEAAEEESDRLGYISWEELKAELKCDTQSNSQNKPRKISEKSPKNS